MGEFKLETPKKFWIDEFVCLRSKMYSFNCGDDFKNKLEGVSEPQWKQIKFEEYKKCLDGEEYQRDCSNYILRSINHEMYLQEVKKSTLSTFDDKRKYLSNFKSLPCNLKLWLFIPFFNWKGGGVIVFVFWNVNILDIYIFEMVLKLIRTMKPWFSEFLSKRWLIFNSRLFKMNLLKRFFCFN